MHTSAYFILQPFEEAGPSGHIDMQPACVASMFPFAAAPARLCVSAESPSQIEI